MPRLPPLGHWQQDVLVIHQPEFWQNEAYNRIFTQASGNCLMPDAFHEFLLAVTRAFGKRFIPVRDMIFWIQQGKTPDQTILAQDLVEKQRLQEAIAAVEAQEGGVIDRSTICLLNPFTILEWMAILVVMRHEHQCFRAVHVIANQMSVFGGGMQNSEVGRWFDEMRDRAYFSRYESRGYHQATRPQSFSAVTAEGESIVLVGPLSEQRLEAMTTEIVEAQENGAILAFLEAVWSDVLPIASIQFQSLTSMGEETISACHAFDAQGQECFPKLDCPFWQEHLSQDALLQADVDACESEEARLDVLNRFLFLRRFFRDFDLPDPRSEHPAFQRNIRLTSLPTRMPHLYERG